MPRKPTPPALTREGRENQLIDLAIDQAEKELREGTASSQVLVHYLKLASTREKREKEKNGSGDRIASCQERRSSC